MKNWYLLWWLKYSSCKYWPNWSSAKPTLIGLCFQKTDAATAFSKKRLCNLNSYSFQKSLFKISVIPHTFILYCQSILQGIVVKLPVLCSQNWLLLLKYLLLGGKIEKQTKTKQKWTDIREFINIVLFCLIYFPTLPVFSIVLNLLTILDLSIWMSCSNQRN